MSAVIIEELGRITIGDDVLSTLTGYLTVENYGVVGMSAQRASDGFVELLKRDNMRKGVKIHTEGDTVRIDLYIIVEYGVSIGAVAQNIIDNVKYKIKELTGLNVVAVNVHVESVRVQQA